MLDPGTTSSVATPELTRRPRARSVRVSVGILRTMSSIEVLRTEAKYAWRSPYFSSILAPSSQMLHMSERHFLAAMTELRRQRNLMNLGPKFTTLRRGHTAVEEPGSTDSS